MSTVQLNTYSCHYYYYFHPNSSIGWKVGDAAVAVGVVEDEVVLVQLLAIY